MSRSLPIASCVALAWLLVAGESSLQADDGHPAANRLRVGSAAASFEADDAMVIGGGIHPKTSQGQEGELRAVAVVLELPPGQRVALVACDVLMLDRQLLDPVAAEIEATCGIPRECVLINCTHTHHAPSTVTVHGYPRDEVFCRRVQRGVVRAVTDASQAMSDAATFSFCLGEESTVGENSRYLMPDGVASWGRDWVNGLRPTGPFDPELPVLAFRDADDALLALIFNHSTHAIGALRGRARSPSFYGLAAQDLERKLGGRAMFLEGASGSTHNLDLEPAEALLRIEQAVLDALEKAEPRGVMRLAALKRPLDFKVRAFDEAEQDAAVVDYCRAYRAELADGIIEVFRQQRRVLAPLRGQTRTTWVQVVLIGDIAICGVPAEFFTILGQEIKRRSPFRYTYVAELANDWVGYLPDRKAFAVGGYQTWTGLHSYAEPGTGEAVVDAVVAMLDELHSAR